MSYIRTKPLSFENLTPGRFRSAFLTILLPVFTACDSHLAVFVNSPIMKSSSFTIQSETNLIQNTFDGLKWEKISGARSYEVKIASDALCENIIFKKEELLEPEIDLQSLAEGAYHFCIYAHVGKNLIPAQNNGLKLTIDKTPPVITTLGEVQSYSVPFQMNLSIKDMTQVKVLWAQESTTGTITISDAEDLKATLSCSQTGLYKIGAQFTDEAGNKIKQSFQFYWDMGNSLGVNPVFTDLPLIAPIADGYLNAADHLTNSVLVGPLVGSQYTEYKTALVPVATLCNAALSYSDSLPLANSTLFLSKGIYRICAELSNGDATKAYGSSATFQYSPDSATIAAVSLFGASSDGYLTLAEHAASTALITVPVTTDADTLEYALASVASSCSGPLNYSSTRPHTDDIRFGSSGTYKVCVRAQDLALNPPAYGESSGIVFSSAAPTITSFLPTNAANDGFINESEKASTAAAWALIANGSTAQDYSLPLNDTSGLLVCNAGSGYGQSSIARLADVLTDGTWALCVRLTDAAGNIVYGKSAALVRDVAPPSAGFVSVETLDRTPPLAGSIGDSSSTLSLTVSGSSYTAVNNGNGTWSIVDGTIASLAYGYHDVTLNVTDLAGNTAATFVYNGLNIRSPSFVSQWKTDNAGGVTANNQIKLPLHVTGVYNFQVNWGDGVTETITTYNASAATHTYPAPGSYTVTINGQIEGWVFGNQGDQTKITNISMWGPLRLGNEENYFSGAENMTITATDALDLTGTLRMYNAFMNCKAITTIPNIGRWKMGSVLSLEGAFRNAERFNDDLNTWDIHSVTNLKDMFQGAKAFNSDIGAWDVSHVTRLEGMFFDALAFNQDIGDWNVSAVTNMAATFWGAYAFNQDLSLWNVSHVTDFTSTFNAARAFNGNISSWNTAAATNMFGMFGDTPVFNQDISGWNTANVTDMGGMFSSALVFNQNLSSWNVAKVTNFSGMFRRAAAFMGDITTWNTTVATNMGDMFLDHPNFNQDIRSWNTGNVVNMAHMFQNATSFTQDIGNWNVSKVTNFTEMFKASKFNHSLAGWNVGAAVNMSYMFADNTVFNSSVSGWNVSSVTDMTGMFYNAQAFNQPLNGWNVSAVKKFESMFNNAAHFNQPLNLWNTGAATHMTAMFNAALDFDQNISGWNVANVQSFQSTFRNAVKFNRDISLWNVGSATSMRDMFSGATAFNQNLGSWDIDDVTDMDGMFYALTLTRANYDGLLQAWAARNVKTNVSFHGGNSPYTAASSAATARNTLTAGKGWTIVDGGPIP
jgi:surface protein